MTMSSQRLPPNGRHYSKPEIIPPGRVDGTGRGDSLWDREAVEEHGIHRIYVTRIGPFSLLPLVLLGSVVSIALLVFLFGFLLILIPVAGLILAAAIIGSFLRGGPRWPR
jgi:hypothetical protein